MLLGLYTSTSPLSKFKRPPPTPGSGSAPAVCSHVLVEDISDGGERVPVVQRLLQEGEQRGVMHVDLIDLVEHVVHQVTVEEALRLHRDHVLLWNIAQARRVQWKYGVERDGTGWTGLGWIQRGTTARVKGRMEWCAVELRGLERNLFDKHKAPYTLVFGE